MTETNNDSINLCADNRKGEELEIASTVSVMETFTITSDVILPSYSSLDKTPFSQWEGIRSRELLEANGFEADYPNAWREAAGHSSMLIRETAYYLLAQSADTADVSLFCEGQHDLSESVQALSTYALYQLGDQNQQMQLHTLVNQAKVEFAVLRAAGLLGAIGDPIAFGAILEGLEGEKSVGTRIASAENIFLFVNLHGQLFEADRSIDVWGAYETALTDPHENVRYVAESQLKELNTPEANQLLDQKNR